MRKLLYICYKCVSNLSYRAKVLDSRIRDVVRNSRKGIRPTYRRSDGIQRMRDAINRTRMYSTYFINVSNTLPGRRQEKEEKYFDERVRAEASLMNGGAIQSDSSGRPLQSSRGRGKGKAVTRQRKSKSKRIQNVQSSQQTDQASSPASMQTESASNTYTGVGPSNSSSMQLQSVSNASNSIEDLQRQVLQAQLAKLQAETEDIRRRSYTPLQGFMDQSTLGGLGFEGNSNTFLPIDNTSGDLDVSRIAPTEPMPSTGMLWTMNDFQVTPDPGFEWDSFMEPDDSSVL